MSTEQLVDAAFKLLDVRVRDAGWRCGRQTSSSWLWMVGGESLAFSVGPFPHCVSSLHSQSHATSEPSVGLALEGVAQPAAWARPSTPQAEGQVSGLVSVGAS